MSLIEKTLMRSSDCVEVIGMDGKVIHTNLNENGKCGDNDDHENMWTAQWPEGSRTSALIGLEEALDGRSHRFDAYRPYKGEDAWWDVTITGIEDDNGISGALAVSRNITKTYILNTERKNQLEIAQQVAEERDLISSEMRHRLKNQITAILSLSQMTAREHDDIKSFLRSFSQRLIQLSTSQDLLSIRNYEPIDLEVAISTIMASAGKSQQVEVCKLPQTKVGAQALTTMALIFGELTTNSLKYGAMTDDRGTVAIDCYDNEGILTFTWREDAKVPITPGSTGIGHQLMKRMSANSGVEFTTEWHETGLTCQFGINSRNTA